MLIPQECHKTALSLGGPAMPPNWMPVTVVVPPRKSFGTRHHEEKGYRRKRRFRFVGEDEIELSEEVDSPDGVSPEFGSLLAGLAEAY